jgi:hypothetical protein
MRLSLPNAFRLYTVALICSGCTTPATSRYSGGRSPEQVAADLEKRYVTTYYDRNGDGRVDYQFDDIPGMADDERAFRDTDFDGRYDVRYDMGWPGGKTRVDLAVPAGVRVTRSAPSHAVDW